MGIVWMAAAAGPFCRERVDADASWVVHVDLERLRESPLATGALADHGTKPGALFNDLRTNLGVDPSTDILEITLYGLPGAGAHTVAVMGATQEADGVPRFLRDAHLPDFQAEAAGSHTVYSWSFDNARQYVCVRPGAQEGKRVLVLGRHREGVLHALDVLDGNRCSLAPDAGQACKAAWPLDQAPDSNAIVFVAAGADMWKGTGPQPHMGGDAKGENAKGEPGGVRAERPWQAARGFVLNVSEQSDETGVRWSRVGAHLRMEDERSAEKMEQVGTKLVSWLSSAAQDGETPESCCRALKSANPVREGTDLRLSMRVNSRDLATILSGFAPVQKPNQDTNGGAEQAGKESAPAESSARPGNQKSRGQSPANNVGLDGKRPR